MPNETAQKGMFVRFTEDQKHRMRHQRGRLGIPMTKFVMDAVTAKLEREEEAERKEGTTRRIVAAEKRERRHLQPSQGLGVSVASPPQSTSGGGFDSGRAATYVLSASGTEERRRRLNAIEETVAVAAPDPAAADDWIKTIRERVEASVSQAPQPKRASSILPDGIFPFDLEGDDD